MRKLGGVLAIICVATLLAQAAGLLLLWTNGTLDRRKLAKMMAVANGIEPKAPSTAATGPSAVVDNEQPSWSDIEQARVLRMRQIELREQSLAAERSRAQTARGELERERAQFDRVKGAFETQLKTDREGALAEGRDRVRALWENMRPKQSKDGIMQMYEQGDVDEVVRIVAEMSPTKQAKIFAEFKTGREPQVVAEITKLIRDGAPQTALIDQTQQNLQPPPEGSP